METLPYICSPYSSKIELINALKINPIQILDIPLLIGKSNLFYFLRPVVLLFYLYITTRFFQANKFLLKNHYSTFQTNILKRWVQMIIIFSAIVYISNLIFTVNNYFTRDIDGLIILTRLAAILLVFLCIQLFINPYVLYGFTEVKYFSNTSLIAKLYLVKEKTAYSQEWIDDLCRQFDQLEMNKSYLQPSYSMKHLKDELQIPSKSITYYFNEVTKVSFTEWKNKKRTEHAIKLIDEGYLRKYTREQLANECGFLSRSNFNQALKKYSTIK
jgi:AraC-like DNA-binding protein